MQKQLRLLEEKKYAARKTARVISVKQFNHVVLKSNRPVLRKNHLLIKRILRETQLRFGIKLKSVAIIEDHIHLCVQTPTRVALANAFRYFAGMIALKINIASGLRSEKLKPKKFWKQKIWSRIVRAGRDLRATVNYILQNPVKAGVLHVTIDLYRIRDGVLLV